MVRFPLHAVLYLTGGGGGWVERSGIPFNFVIIIICDHIETTTQTRLGCNTEQTAVVLLANKYG